MVAGSGVQKYGPDLEEHQQLLLAAADILIEIYMAESGLLRVEKNVKRFGLVNQSIQIKMAQLYLYQAVDIISQRAQRRYRFHVGRRRTKDDANGIKAFYKIS